MTEMHTSNAPKDDVTTAITKSMLNTAAVRSNYYCHAQCLLHHCLGGTK